MIRLKCSALYPIAGTVSWLVKLTSSPLLKSSSLSQPFFQLSSFSQVLSAVNFFPQGDCIQILSLWVSTELCVILIYSVSSHLLNERNYPLCCFNCVLRYFSISCTLCFRVWICSGSSLKSSGQKHITFFRNWAEWEFPVLLNPFPFAFFRAAMLPAAQYILLILGC